MVSIVADPLESAKLASLRHVNDITVPGVRRFGSRNRSRYVDPHGRPVTDRAELVRIRSLVIPPAWTDGWISMPISTTRRLRW